MLKTVFCWRGWKLVVLAMRACGVAALRYSLDRLRYVNGCGVKLVTVVDWCLLKVRVWMYRTRPQLRNGVRDLER